MHANLPYEFAYVSRLSLCISLCISICYIYKYLLYVDLAHLDSWQAISLCVDLHANLLHVILPHVLPTLTFLLFISYIH
jgi:hypothetical protein